MSASKMNEAIGEWVERYSNLVSACMAIVLLLLTFVFAGAVVVRAAAKRPGAVLGAEVYRRTLPAGQVVRIYRGTTLLSETAVSGDTRVTVGVGAPVPVPTPSLSQLETPGAVTWGGTATGTVRLKAPVSAPTAVGLSSDQPAVISVPATAVVPAGAAQATFPLTAGPAAVSQQSAMVTATLGAVRMSQRVEVLPAPPPPPPPPPPPGIGWYVAPDGKATNLGTAESPWDLESTVNGTRKSTLAQGGTVWLLPGTYRIPPAQNREGLGFRCVVGGTSSNPLVFRAMPSGRVSLDGGWSFFSGSNNTWLWGVEVIVSDLVEGKPPFGLSGSWPEGAPNGGCSLYTSKGCRVINCLIHRNRQGANLWTEAEDAELYGCVLYDNGWVGSDRAHGHSIYVQNPAGRKKVIADNIITATPYSRGWRDGRYTLHGYGERVAVTDLTVEGNFQAQDNDAWLLGAGVDSPSAGHRMLNNAIYGVRVRVGSRPDQPLEFKGNIIQGVLELIGGGPITASDNLVVGQVDGSTAVRAVPRPATDQVLLRQNKYEPERANLMLIDWTGNSRVRLEPSGWLAPGERVRIVEPTDWWGPPLFSGAWPAAGIELPVQGARVLVALKEGVAVALPPASVAARIEEAPVSPRLKR